MIAVIGKDAVSVYELSIEEFWKIYKRSGINASEFHRYTSAYRRKETYKNIFMAEYLDDIEICYSEVAGDLLKKPINSIDDLDYYKAPDGKKFTCKDDYKLEEAQPQTERYVVDKTEQSEAVLGGKLSGDMPVTETQQELEKTIVSEEVAPTLEVVSSGETVVAEEDVKKDFLSAINDDAISHQGARIEEGNNVIRNFDSMLNALPHILSEGRDRMIHFIKALASEITFEEKQAALKNKLSRQDFNDIINYENDKPINTSLGKSTDILDSVLTFPVYSAIVSKHDLKENFTYMRARNSFFLRFCPIAFDPREDGVQQGYFEAVKIEGNVVNAFKDSLKDRGETLRDYPSEEQLPLFEKFASAHYEEVYGSLSTEPKGIQPSLNECFEELGRDKFYLGNIIDDKDNFACSTYGNLYFDNRQLIDNQPVKIIDQLEKAYMLEETVDRVVTDEPVAQEMPVLEPAEVPEQAISAPDATDEMLGNIVEELKDSGAPVTLEQLREKLISLTKEGLANLYETKEVVAAPQSLSAMPSLTQYTDSGDVIVPEIAAPPEPAPVVEDFIGAAIRRISGSDVPPLAPSPVVEEPTLKTGEHGSLGGIDLIVNKKQQEVQDVYVVDGFEYQSRELYEYLRDNDMLPKRR